MSKLSIREEIDVRVDRANLSEEDGLALHSSGAFEVTFPSPLTDGQYVIRSKGWIGHISVSTGLIVTVAPKLPVLRLFAMLEVAYRLKSFSFLEGETHVATLEDLIEHLAFILARRVLVRVRKGLYKSYIHREEPLGFARGRVLLLDSLARLRRGDVRLQCEYEELTSDLEDNQILFWTIYKTSKAVRRNDVKTALLRAHKALSGEIQLIPMTPADCVGRTYQRLNDDYRPMHGLCRLLLSCLGPDIKEGENIVLPFKLNMWSLFEEFVEEWLKQNADPNWEIKAQYRSPLQSTTELEYRIDLLIFDKPTGRPIAVLDTKYKAAGSPSSDDVMQVVAYCVEHGVEQAFLVYPAPLLIPLDVKTGDIRVRSLVFDLSIEPSDAGEAFLKTLSHILEDDISDNRLGANATPIVPIVF